MTMMTMPRTIATVMLTIQSIDAAVSLDLWIGSTDERLVLQAWLGWAIAEAAKRHQHRLHSKYWGCWYPTVKNTNDDLSGCFYFIAHLMIFKICTNTTMPCNINHQMKTFSSPKTMFWTVNKSPNQWDLFKSWNRPDFRKSSFLETPA